MTDRIFSNIRLKIYGLVLICLCAVSMSLNIVSAQESKSDLPEHLAKADKILIYRVEGWNTTVHTNGQNFRGFAILSGPKQLIGETADQIANSIDQAFVSSWQERKCIFDPIVGITFYFSDRKIDVLLCFHCNQMCCYEGSKTLQTSDLGKIRKELVPLLKGIYPDDKDIQSLK